MPVESSSAAEWFSLLEPACYPRESSRPDDPRLAECIERWDGATASIRPGRAVLVGFPVDEGVRRNFGRPGAALAPAAIRNALANLCSADPVSGVNLAASSPLDLGDIRTSASLEEDQERLGDVVAEVLRRGANPILIGGGHETAYGHFLGYVKANLAVGIVNVDAHLDVRPLGATGASSGTPFRQALEHPTHPLQGSKYSCLGLEPQSTSWEHWQYAKNKGCRTRWRADVSGRLVAVLQEEIAALTHDGHKVCLSIDADVVCGAEAPGVSAPNVCGLSGAEVIAAIRKASASKAVASFEVVEINPKYDLDNRTCRWGALAIWSFLVGHACRDVG